jgi:DNA-binding SARP family transcriptional activator
VLRDGVRVDGWERRRTQLLLAALVLYPHGLNVPELADVLGEAMAESKWRVAVSYLRQALEPGLAKGRASRFVTMVHDRYVLAPEALAYVDVRAFEAGIAAARRVRDVDPVAAARAYGEALGHHAGELLADAFFARYFEDAREQLRVQAVEARLWLARWSHDRGDRRDAEGHVQAAMALAPADEHVALAAQAFWREAQEPTRAAQVYWDHRRARQLRFGLPPCEAVEAAHRQALAPPARR